MNKTEEGNIENGVQIKFFPKGNPTIVKEKDIQIKEYKEEKIKFKSEKDSLKSILFIGKTGTGKSNLLMHWSI